MVKIHTRYHQLPCIIWLVFWKKLCSIKISRTFHRDDYENLHANGVFN